MQEPGGQVETPPHAPGVATAAPVDPVSHAEQGDQFGDAAIPLETAEVIKITLEG